MIVCHRHQYIFLKTNKTAGTSTEIALTASCGDRAVITPLTSEDEELRRVTTGRTAQNYVIPLSACGWREARKLIQHRRRPRFFHHMQARDVKRLVGDDVWDGYTTFCIERNPWDRFISFYYWRTPAANRPTIDEFLESKEIQLLKMRGWEVYSIEGEVAVDRVLRFESLADDLDDIRKDIGIPDPLDLPYTKSTSRADRRHYRDVLSQEQADRIAELFSDEIELFGYEF